MANLETIKSLNVRYSKQSKIRQHFKTNLSEGFDLKLRYDRDKLVKAISSTVASLGPNYSRYFDFGLSAEVALLFIDICDFSSRFASLNGEKIGINNCDYYQAQGSLSR